MRQRVRVGRALLPIMGPAAAATAAATTAGGSLELGFAPTGHMLHVLEQVSACVEHGEPTLLVGETGSGKTSSVQFLSRLLGVRLHVMNMSQQSDSADLLGGFKPVDPRTLCLPVIETFLDMFVRSFSRKANMKFLQRVEDAVRHRQWPFALTLLANATKLADDRMAAQQRQQLQELSAAPSPSPSS